MSDVLWNADKPVRDYGVDVPRWIDQDITASDVAAILQGGCASGAYMPAVTYVEALDTMEEWGDEIFDYLDSMGVRVSVLAASYCDSWASMACAFVSAAVETWAACVEDTLTDAVKAEDNA